MHRLPLRAIQVVGAFLVLNPPITALIGFDRYENPSFALAAIVLYTFVSLMTVLYFRAREMPPLLAWVNLLTAAIIPQLVHESIDAVTVDSQTSWYVSGLGALLAVTAIRGQQAVSWIGASILALEVLVSGGSGTLFNSGLAGALSLLFAANVLSYALSRIDNETQAYLDKAIEIEAAAEIESATLAERSRRLNETLGIAYPLLQKISNGEIDQDSRQEAKLLEAELRDGIRGRELIDNKLKVAIREARLRGVEVVVLDEGGLSALAESSKAEIRQKFASELAKISSGRVTIRAPRGRQNSATFVASRPGTATPDLFLKL